MCYIFAYLIFVPIAKELAARLDNPSISTATALALGAVASFNLVYPLPVIISVAEELSANADKLFILGFLISVLTSIAGYLYARRLGKTEITITSKSNNQEYSGPEKTETAQSKKSGVQEQLTATEEKVTCMQGQTTVLEELTGVRQKVTVLRVKEA